MLKSIRIENYKSIEDLNIDLGRVNVFIGENGAGKSNILEAIAFAGAAASDKLDNEFLAARGIRVCGPTLMRSAFRADQSAKPIKISAEMQTGEIVQYSMSNDNRPYSSWEKTSTAIHKMRSVEIQHMLLDHMENLSQSDKEKFLKDLKSKLLKAVSNMKPGENIVDSLNISVAIELKESSDLPVIDSAGLDGFIIYSPENSALRLYEREGQIEPLGINGEGLFKLIRVLSRSRNRSAIRVIKDNLHLFNWFNDFSFKSRNKIDSMQIEDRFLDGANNIFDQASANEGFLFVTFYLTLFVSSLTPKFFAVDNIDSSLNPKMCRELMRILARLASDHNKQALLTTHNPALLDGLDLNDPDQRLFVVSRSSDGLTRVRRYSRKPSSGEPRRLSDLFLSGELGGLPKGF